jgi:hypothetical protein
VERYWSVCIGRDLVFNDVLGAKLAWIRMLWFLHYGNPKGATVITQRKAGEARKILVALVGDIFLLKYRKAIG